MPQKLRKSGLFPSRTSRHRGTRRPLGAEPLELRAMLSCSMPANDLDASSLLGSGFACTDLLNKGQLSQGVLDVVGEMYYQFAGSNLTVYTNVAQSDNSGNVAAKLGLDDDNDPVADQVGVLGNNALITIDDGDSLPPPASQEEGAGQYEVLVEILTAPTLASFGGVQMAGYSLDVDGYDFMNLHFNQVAGGDDLSILGFFSRTPDGGDPDPCLAHDPRTRGFWSNKHGERLIESDLTDAVAALNNLHLRSEDGTDAVFASADDVRSWMKHARARNMADMLSVQLAAAALNVHFGLVSGTAQVHSAGAESANALGIASLEAIIAEASAALEVDGVTTAGHPQRPYQELLKDILDDANNGRNFVDSTPCPVEPPTHEGPHGGGRPDDVPRGNGPPDDVPRGDGRPDDVPRGNGNGPPDDVPRGNGNGPPDDVPRGNGNGPPDDVPRGNGPPEDVPRGNGPPEDVPRGNGNGPPEDVPRSARARLFEDPSFLSNLMRKATPGGKR